MSPELSVVILLGINLGLVWLLLAAPLGRRTLRLRRSFDADALYAALAIPVLFTHGTHDRVVPLAASEAGHAITPGSQLSIYAGIGHAPFMEAADRFNTELGEFVRLCSARP